MWPFTQFAPHHPNYRRPSRSYRPIFANFTSNCRPFTTSCTRRSSKYRHRGSVNFRNDSPRPMKRSLNWTKLFCSSQMSTSSDPWGSSKPLQKQKQSLMTLATLTKIKNTTANILAQRFIIVSGIPVTFSTFFTFCGNCRPVKIRCNFHVNSTPPPLLFSSEVAPPEGGSAGRLIPSPWKRKLQTEINKWRAPRTGNFQNNVGGKGTIVSRVQRDGMSFR